MLQVGAVGHWHSRMKRFLSVVHPSHLVCSCSGYRCFQPCLRSPRSQPVSMLAGCGGMERFWLSGKPARCRNTPEYHKSPPRTPGTPFGRDWAFHLPQRAGWSRGSAVGQSARPAGGFQLGKSQKCARKHKHSGLIPGDIYRFCLLTICPSSSPLLLVFIPAKNGKCTPSSRTGCQPGAHTLVPIPWHPPMALVGRSDIEHQSHKFSTQTVGAHPRGTATCPWHGAGASGASAPAVPTLSQHHTPGSPGTSRDRNPFSFSTRFCHWVAKIAGGKSACCMLHDAKSSPFSNTQTC